MRKTAGMNKHQKAVYKTGEKRLAPQEIPELLGMSESADPDERLIAAELLCPCHVRRRIEEVWDALFRMLEDPDVRVRRAAWHTLEDGGRPSDPRMDEILDRAMRDETDSHVRRFAEIFTADRKARESVLFKALGRPAPRLRGRCDFCGEGPIPVERDLDTMIPTDDLPRAALICDVCARSA